MKLWLDDIREMPIEYDIHVRNPRAAIALLKAGLVSEISLDHDLNFQSYIGAREGEETGYTVAAWIEEQAYAGTLSRIKWHIHSANPVGSIRMKQALENAERYWDGKN